MKAKYGTVLLIGLLCTWESRGGESEAARGHQVFAQWCAACHGEGIDKPGTSGLAAKYSGALPAELEKRTDLTPDLIKQFVRHGFAMMPPFRKTEIGDTDLQALSAYLSRKPSARRVKQKER